MPRYEYINPAENARKFYEIEMRVTPSGRYEVEVQWGRIGATPTRKIHTFPLEYLAQNKYNELIQQKTAKGYRQVGNQVTSNIDKIVQSKVIPKSIVEVVKKKEEKVVISDPRVASIIDELFGGNK